MSGRTFKHQPRASKEGWTNAHEHLIHLYVAFGLKSEGTALLKHTKLISITSVHFQILSLTTLVTEGTAICKKRQEGH